MRLGHLTTRVSRKLATTCGYDLIRRDAGALARLARQGVSPATVIDVGAALGDWTLGCAQVFPDADYLLIEPLDEFRPAVEAAAETVSGTVVAAAAAAQPGTRTLNVHRDLVGSSLLREREGSQVDGTPRNVNVISIDSLLSTRGATKPPFLIKVNVQGAELEVLTGATQTLTETVALVVEVSFFAFYFDGTEFDRLVATMRGAGFVVFDIENLSRRPLDGALSQADVIFVPDDSPARREHAYASTAQREAQDAEFAATMKRRLERAARR